MENLYQLQQICADCENDCTINDGRWWKYDTGVWLCDDCYSDRMEADALESELMEAEELW